MIAIIVILAAMLFPVFGRARANARHSVCQSNLKQISLATLMYAQDYDFRHVTYHDGILAKAAVVACPPNVKFALAAALGLAGYMVAGGGDSLGDGKAALTY